MHRSPTAYAAASLATWIATWLATWIVTGCVRPAPTAGGTGDPPGVYGRTADTGGGAPSIHLSAVTEDGAIEAMRGSPIPTDTEGRFFASLIELEDVEPRFLIALSTDAAGRHIAVADARAAVDGQLAMPVLDDESTVEGEVFLAAYRAGHWDERRHLHRLRDLVTPKVAGAVLAADDYRAAVDLVAESTVAAMAAWEESLLPLGFAAEDVDELEAVLQTARATADLEVVDARAVLDEQLAADRYDRAWELAHHRAGMSPHALAVAAVAAAEAVHARIRGLDTPVAHVLGWRGEELRVQYAGAWLLQVASSFALDGKERRALRRKILGLQLAAHEARGAPDRDHLRIAYAPLVRQLERSGERALAGRRFHNLCAEALTILDDASLGDQDGLDPHRPGAPRELGRAVGARVATLLAGGDRPSMEEHFLQALVVSRLPGRRAPQEPGAGSGAPNAP